jgi:hypothetical protein
MMIDRGIPYSIRLGFNFEEREARSFVAYGRADIF